MKLIHVSIISLALAATSCFPPPKKSAADYAPQEISFRELTEININAFYGEGGSSLAGDYVISLNGQSILIDDAAENLGMTIAFPFTMGPDGFEITFRSSDIESSGMLVNIIPDIPEFKARITASNASGMYARGFSPDIGTQHAFINADVYQRIKEIYKPLMRAYADPAALEAMTATMFQEMSIERLATLCGTSMMDELTLTLNRVEGNLFYYDFDFANQGYAVVQNVLSQVDEDELLDLVASENAQAAEFLQLFLSLSDEQLAPILPASMNLFNIDSEYVLALTDKKELILVSFSLDIAVPPPAELVDRLLEWQDVMPAEFGIPKASREEVVAAVEMYQSLGIFDCEVNLFAGIKKSKPKLYRCS